MGRKKNKPEPLEEDTYSLFESFAVRLSLILLQDSQGPALAYEKQRVAGHLRKAQEAGVKNFFVRQTRILGEALDELTPHLPAQRSLEAAESVDKIFRALASVRTYRETQQNRPKKHRPAPEPYEVETRLLAARIRRVVHPWTFETYGGSKEVVEALQVANEVVDRAAADGCNNFFAQRSRALLSALEYFCDAQQLVQRGADDVSLTGAHRQVMRVVESVETQ